ADCGIWVTQCRIQGIGRWALLVVRQSRQSLFYALPHTFFNFTAHSIASKDDFIFCDPPASDSAWGSELASAEALALPFSRPAFVHSLSFLISAPPGPCATGDHFCF